MTSQEARTAAAEYFAGQAPAPPDCYDADTMSFAIDGLAAVIEAAGPSPAPPLADILNLIATKDFQGLEAASTRLLNSSAPSTGVAPAMAATLHRAIAAALRFNAPALSVRHCTAVLDIEPEHLATGIQLAAIRSTMGDPVGANDALENTLLRARHAGEKSVVAHCLYWNHSRAVDPIAQLASIRETLEAADAALCERPDDPACMALKARAMLSSIYLRAAEMAGASQRWTLLPEFDEALSLAERAAAKDPKHLGTNAFLASALEALGNFASLSAGHPSVTASIRAYEDVPAKSDALRADFRAAWSETDIHQVWHLVRPGGRTTAQDRDFVFHFFVAHRLYARAHDVIEQLALAYPKDLFIRRELFTSHRRLSQAAAAVFRSGMAIKSMEAALCQLEAIIAAEPANERARASLPATQQELLNLKLNATRFGLADGMDEIFQGSRTVAHSPSNTESAPQHEPSKSWWRNLFKK